MSNLRCVDLSDPAVVALIRRIFFKRFASNLAGKGMDPDDVLQEIYLGFMGRNAGKNPFNPEVASLSTYVYTVIQSVVRNMIDSSRRSVRRNGDLGGTDDAAMWDSSATHKFVSTSLNIRDSARELGVPESFLGRVVNGEDPWSVANDEYGFIEAMALVDRFDAALRERGDAPVSAPV
jgi:DNA-directed RNA polymerase specialized sigma24 family protein